MEIKELLTKRRIEALADRYNSEAYLLHRSFSDIDKPIDMFVSHSSSDNEFVKKVNAFLYYNKGGINPYVDWQDLALPPETNATTAEILKKKIMNSRKVIYVVTNDSLKSVWVHGR